MTRLCCWIAGRGGLVRECAALARERGHTVSVATDDYDVATFCAREGIQFRERLGADELGDADVLFSIANGWILDRRMLAAPRLCLNFHNGPLPRYAGGHATSWAILYGETHYEVVWHIMEEGIDTGDVVMTIPIAIDPEETTETLNLKCYDAGLASFTDLLARVEGGAISRRPQERRDRIYFSVHQKPDAAGLLRWDRSASELDQTVRSLNFGMQHNGLASPKMLVGDLVLLVGELTVCDSSAGAEPGTVTDAGRDHFRIATATDDVIVRQLSRLDGRPLVELPRSTRLPLIDDATANEITHHASSASRHEASWLDVLRRASAVPNARPADAPSVARGTSLGSVSAAPALAAAALVTYERTGSAVSWLLHRDASSAAPPGPSGLWFPYLLLAVDLQGCRTLGDAVARGAMALEVARARGLAFADLWMRSPRLRRSPPTFATCVSLGHEDVESPPASLLLSSAKRGAEARGTGAREALARWRAWYEHICRTQDASIDVSPATPPVKPPPLRLPATATERRVAMVWRSVTGRRDIALDDDVTCLLDDLEVAQLASALQARFGIAIDVGEHSTVAAQAERVRLGGNGS